MELRNYFIVGIKGVAMCHIAVILKKMGKTVTGADIADSFITDEVLSQNDIPCQVGFEPGALPPDTEVVIYSAAHGGIDNPIVLIAQEKGIRVVSQADFLGNLISKFNISIAVCGTHGKTTTSSLLAYALIKLGAKPSYMIGSSTFSAGDETFIGGDYNGADYFVIEADEYGVNPPKDKTPKFHKLIPSQALCLNVDYDHPDMYENVEAVAEAFKTFLAHVQTRVIYCQDDVNTAMVAATLPQDKAEGYGLSPQAEYRIKHYELRAGKPAFTLENDIETVENIELALYGEKNVLNAAGVIAVLLNLGFAPAEIKAAVKDFTGPKRRMEIKFEKNGTTLVDDYAHHPQEIEATVSALRARFPGKRLILIFQPHTFSRTQKLLKEFTTALSSADTAFVLPIFASARESRADATISSGQLGNGTTVFSISDNAAVLEKLKGFIKGGEVIVTMGAGDVYKLDTDIIEVVKHL